MKKRNLLVITLALFLLLLPMAGSLAFFTRSETAHNVITTGNVDIEIHEYTRNEAGELVPFTNPEGVMPGEKIHKIVQIKNTGSGPAWVRVRLNPEFKLDPKHAPEGFEADVSLAVLQYNDEEKLWRTRPEGEDPCVYYQKPLAPGETTVPVIEAVEFKNEMGNEYQESEFILDVEAEAVQMKNNGSSVFEAAGWPNAAPLPSAPLT